MSDEETRETWWSDDPDEQSDLSHSVSRRPLRRRWLVFSFLIGVSLVAGVATFILVLMGFIKIVRSPLPVSDESWCIWAVLIAMVALCAGWATRPSKRLTAGSFWGAAIVLAFTTVFAYPLVKAGIVKITWSGMSIPGFVGQLMTAWGCFTLAVLTNIAGRAYAHASLPSSESRNSSVASESDGDVELDITVSDILSGVASKLPVPRESQHEESEESEGSGDRRRVGTYAQRLGLGAVGVATATALAVAAPMAINRRIDPFIHVTAKASSHYEGYPSVEKIVEAAAGQEQSAADSDWKVSFGDVNVKQILAGVRGAVVITDRGVYGLDSATGESTWSFSTADLKESSHESDVRSLRGVEIYAEESAFTSPNGAWLAYAFDVTPEGSSGGGYSPDDVTRVVVLNTDTGRIALDTQVTGSAPTVQLTDSTAVINRRIYDAASGRELAPLDAEKAAIPGPGGHSTVLALRQEEDLSRSSGASVDTLSDQYLRAGESDQWLYDNPYDDIHAQVIDGRIINVGGWVVNDIDKGTIQNIDTGGTVSLNNKGESRSWRIVGIEASAQAVSTWSVQDYVDGDARNYGHPLELNVFDTRAGKVTTVDPAGTYRTATGSGSLALGTPYSGSVDNAVFSERVKDQNHAGSDDDFVIRQNDATRQVRGDPGRGSDSESPWVNISLPEFRTGRDPVALCPGGMIVSLDSDLSSDSSRSTVSARKAI
ncbi:fatty acid desaturase [Actinomyces johnsonii]|uniref:Fatty acid desaturase n=1 Tax=Actinomyces johnsonii TaxID=544581 RepID=A0A507ZW46_9ACTO|nr:fatty acid desaturase [Actinomyces johnsonii]KAA8737364.1 fatty acid desaturase [Actinomyces johnsonii]TQD41930.1 fatty acid desaturase [Actinomyces johnsonii]